MLGLKRGKFSWQPSRVAEWKCGRVVAFHRRFNDIFCSGVKDKLTTASLGEQLELEMLYLEAVVVAW